MVKKGKCTDGSGERYHNKLGSQVVCSIRFYRSLDLHFRCRQVWPQKIFWRSGIFWKGPEKHRWSCNRFWSACQGQQTPKPTQDKPRIVSLFQSPDLQFHTPQPSKAGSISKRDVQAIQALGCKALRRAWSLVCTQGHGLVAMRCLRSDLIQGNCALCAWGMFGP